MKKIDAHMHVSGDPQRFLGCEAESVIDAADWLEIDWLACSVPITGGKWATPADVRECNDAMLEAMQCHPGRILGYCFLNTGYIREALQELERCVIAGGMVGVKLYNQYKINDPVVFPLIERTIELGVPILSHAGRLLTAADIADLARACPDARIVVLEALGVENSPFVHDPSLADAQVAFEFARMTSVLHRSIPALLDRVGPRRLAFGTGMPLKIPGPAVLKFQLLDAPADVKVRIASGNMERLLGGNVD